MGMRIRNVRTVGHRPYIYIYIARLIIEHHREWLASLADNKINPIQYKNKIKNISNRCYTIAYSMTGILQMKSLELAMNWDGAG